MSFSLGFQPPAAGDPGPGGATLGNLEKQLVCPICLEMFSKPVVILPCQHNLCRKCANDIFQAANPPWQPRGSSSVVSTGGRFRCPSCRHEVVLDRHGVYGLQRNLLVENIIDICRKQESSRPADVKAERHQQQQWQKVMCEEHEEERINIYCLSCQMPTCSMCKVFGLHRECDVAPLCSVYQRQKGELSDGIAILVGNNDRIQSLISQMEEICRTIEENGRHQREQLVNRFDELVAILEERKEELVGFIAKQQDEKLKYVRSLISDHGEHLEAGAHLVETAIQSMEERDMATFLQSVKEILEKIADTAKASRMQRLDAGYHDMSRFVIDIDDVADMLGNIDFCSGSECDKEVDREDGSKEPESPAGAQPDHGTRS